MRTVLRPAIVSLVITSVLCGLVYPVVVTVFAQVLFPRQANGSLMQGGTGSELIGQPFTQPGFFWSRPSATAPSPYNASSSSGSNLGPANPALRSAIAARVEALRAHGGGPVIPVDLVTTSASGLDPDISLEAALYQAPRVAKVRGLSEAEMRALVERHTTRSPLANARVNVLAINLDLATR